jgi:hypothetical protein
MQNIPKFASKFNVNASSDLIVMIMNRILSYTTIIFQAHFLSSAEKTKDLSSDLQYHYNTTTGGGEFCPGKLTLRKILPRKNAVPKIKDRCKISVPSGFGRVKRKFGAKRRRNFWLII